MNSKEAHVATHHRSINRNWILEELGPNLVCRVVVPSSGTKFAYSVISVQSKLRSEPYTFNFVFAPFFLLNGNFCYSKYCIGDCMIIRTKKSPDIYILFTHDVDENWYRYTLKLDKCKWIMSRYWKWFSINSFRKRLQWDHNIKSTIYVLLDWTHRQFNRGKMEMDWWKQHWLWTH